jgi:hypothetical protein
MVLNDWDEKQSFSQRKIRDENYDSESQATYNSEAEDAYSCTGGGAFQINRGENRCYGHWKIQGEPPILSLRRNNSMKLVGIVFILLGVLALVYQGVRYTTKENLIDIGPLKVTATEKKTIPLPPIVGGVAIVAGIALILVERKKT